MRIMLLLHHYEDDPTLMPNVIAATDEFIIDAAGEDYWEEEKARAMDMMGPGSFREVVLKVSDIAITDVFKVPKINATVEEPT